LRVHDQRENGGILDLLEQQSRTARILIQRRNVRKLEMPVDGYVDAMQQAMLFACRDEVAQIIDQEIFSCADRNQTCRFSPAALDSQRASLRSL